MRTIGVAKELGFECRLHRVLVQKLGLNIYHCKNFKLRRLNETL